MSPLRVLPGGAYSTRAYLVDGGGNGDYSTIQAALNAAHAQAPTAVNRWLVMVGPGNYAESLTLYDYVDISGMAPGATAVVTAPAGKSAIATAANSWITNMRFSGLFSPIITIAVSGLVMTFEGVVMNESTPAIDGIEVSADSTVTIRNSDLKVGGDVVSVGAGTVKIYNSTLSHYNTDTGSGTEYPLLITGGDVTADHCVLDNLGVYGGGVHLTIDPHGARVLHSTIRKASGTNAVVADLAAANAYVVDCILNGNVDSDVGTSSGNTVVAGI